MKAVRHLTYDIGKYCFLKKGIIFRERTLNECIANLAVAAVSIPKYRVLFNF